MSRSRKSTAAEAKLKKKEYDRKRREKLKNCPETLEKLREKERLKYLKKEEKGINNFTLDYSEPGHGKGAPDGVGGTLKRSADQAVAEGKDVTDLNVLKNVLSSKCPSIMLIEVGTGKIEPIASLEHHSSTQKVLFDMHLLMNVKDCDLCK
ncbi:hypothetical protein JTB14_010645 [Gonioctena quinquepunctata]|nr:hypothetical protein JTB14_010645 [Gonioctena quinquepunctata]